MKSTSKMKTTKKWRRPQKWRWLQKLRGPQKSALQPKIFFCTFCLCLVFSTFLWRCSKMDEWARTPFHLFLLNLHKHCILLWMQNPPFTWPCLCVCCQAQAKLQLQLAWVESYFQCFSPTRPGMSFQDIWGHHQTYLWNLKAFVPNFCSQLLFTIQLLFIIFFHNSTHFRNSCLQLL